MDYSKSVKEFTKYKSVRVHNGTRNLMTTIKPLPSPNTTKKCLNFNASYASVISDANDSGISFN